MPRILRLSLRSFFSSSVSNSPSSTIEPAIGSTLNAIGATYFSGCGNVDRRAVVGQLARAVDDLADLLVELVDAGTAAARDRLVGADDQPGEAGLGVQRPSDRHRGHRRAVRVGDDALAGVGDRAAGLTSLTTSGTSGSIRQAEELSMTISAGSGEPLAPVRARSSHPPRTTRCRVRWGRRRRRPRRRSRRRPTAASMPAERAEAKNRN